MKKHVKNNRSPNDKSVKNEVKKINNTKVVKKNKEKNEEQKKLKINFKGIWSKVFSILFILFVILGFSYAVFNYNTIGIDSSFITGELYLHYYNGEIIQIDNILPTDTYDKNNYFEFSVKGKNTHDKDVLYKISLSHGDDVEDKIRLDDKFLKFRLVEVIDNKEVEIFNNREFQSINNTDIHMDGVVANTNTEMEKVYRLYVWINGVIIGNTETANYTSEEWESIYTNIKVIVEADSYLNHPSYTINYNHLLPDMYQELEYIENTGTQFIDTGVVPSSDLKTDIVYMDLNTSGSNYVLGSRTGANGSLIHYGIGGSDTTSKISVYYNNDLDTEFSSVRTSNNLYHITLDMEHDTSNGYRMNATLNDLTNNTSENISTPYKEELTGELPNIYVFSLTNENQTHNGMRLYSLKFYKGEELIRNFIPCYRKNDGVIGLYDMVTQEFYTNSGSDNFTSGNLVDNNYHVTNSQSFVFGLAENLDANEFVASDKPFLEWNTNPNGTGEYYFDLDSVKNISSVDKEVINFYAMYEVYKSYDGYLVYDMLKEQAVADNIKSKYVANENGINFFDKSSKKNGYGIYTLTESKNDTYPVYYYRGDVKNNNILFNGYCWKIIRTTDTGGTKLIYNGKPTNGSCDNIGLDTFVSSGVYFATTTSTKVGLASAGYSYTEETRLVTTTKTSGNIAKVPGTIFANDVEYVEITDETTGETKWMYRLIGEKVTSTGTTAATFNTEREALLNEHHYTCFSATSDVCSTVSFIYMVRDSNNYYLNLSNGLLLEDFLNIEFNGNSTNKTKSTVHVAVNNWYNNNLLNVNDYIEDTVYCNDRTLYQPWTSTSSVANEVDLKTHFGAKARVAYTGGVTVKCPNIADSFTVSITKGNGKLENPIGLITLDEVVLAGYAWGYEVTDNYLYTGEDNKVWWTMSPGFISATGVYPAVVYSQLDTVGTNYRGSQDSVTKLWSGGGVRPVISLKNTIKIGSGLGTSDQPFILQ